MFLVALLCAFLAGQSAAFSALLGGIAVIVGSFVGLLFSQRADGKKDAGAVLLIMLQAEVMKIVIIATLLFIAFKAYTALIPLALVAGLAATAVFSGAALAGTAKQSLG